MEQNISKPRKSFFSSIDYHRMRVSFCLCLYCRPDDDMNKKLFHVLADISAGNQKEFHVFRFFIQFSFSIFMKICEWNSTVLTDLTEKWVNLSSHMLHIDLGCVGTCHSWMSCSDTSGKLAIWWIFVNSKSGQSSKCGEVSTFPRVHWWLFLDRSWLLWFHCIVQHCWITSFPPTRAQLRGKWQRFNKITPPFAIPSAISRQRNRMGNSLKNWIKTFLLPCWCSHRCF